MVLQPVLTLAIMGSLASSRISGGAARGRPWGSRHRHEARSKRKPSTWYSSTQLQGSQPVSFDFLGSAGSQYN